MEWTAERNPDREYNFRIRELGAGRFAVVSDSERFGADQVVFESFRRGECVDYVTQRRDPGKWNYYVIEDLRTARPAGKRRHHRQAASDDGRRLGRRV